VDKDGFKNLVTCSDMFASGQGSKMFAADATPATMLEDAESIKGRLHSGFMMLSAASGLSDARMADQDAASAADAELRSNAELRAPSCAAVSGGTGPHCKPTCNGKPLAWNGWWPCKCAAVATVLRTSAMLRRLQHLTCPRQEHAGSHPTLMSFCAPCRGRALV
jgi:hypothetical protein